MRRKYENSLVFLLVIFFKPSWCLQEIFSDIYFSKGWQFEETVSGIGSTLAATQAIRTELPDLLKKLGTKDLLDIPCGDFRWMKEVELPIDHYYGADIVVELVISLQKKFGNDIRTFMHLDATCDQLPKVDTILCRDCLQHLTYEHVKQMLLNIKKSNATYLIVTNYSGATCNTDIQDGQWRPLNLLLPPFNFPEPLFCIDEQSIYDSDKKFKKELMVFALKDIMLDGISGEDMNKHYDFASITKQDFLDLLKAENSVQFHNNCISKKPVYWMINEESASDAFITQLNELFKKNFVPFNTIRSAQKPIIPLIIHQIWLGETPPERILKLLTQWYKLPNNWQYMLWNEQTIEELNLHNKALYDACANFAQKADIARIEILYRFGGLYLDVDVELIKLDKLEDLHFQYDFYAGLEALSSQSPFTVGNAIIACRPGDKFLLHLMLELELWLEECKKKCDPENKITYIWQPICLETGPGYFSNLFFKYIQREMPLRTIIFPPQFFHAWYNHDKDSLAILRHKFFASWL